MKPKRFAIRKGKVVVVPMKRKKKKSPVRKARENRDAKKHYENRKAREFYEKFRDSSYAYWEPKEQKICPNCNIILLETQSSCELCGWAERTRHISKSVRNDVWNRDDGKCVKETCLCENCLEKVLNKYFNFQQKKFKRYIPPSLEKRSR